MYFRTLLQGDSDDLDASEPSLVELLRLARTYQGLVDDLLVRAERMVVAAAPAALGGGGSSDNERLVGVRRRLTEREAHVAKLLIKGMSNRRIARALAISERTVKNHLHSIFYKLGVSDRTQAVIVLMRGAGSP